MPRGKASKVGDTNVAKNGYHYTRCEGGWRLTHHLVAEEKLGRPIREDETVSFKDNDRENFHPDNIVVSAKRTSVKGRLAVLYAKRMELNAEIEALEAKVAKQQETRR